MHNRFRLAQINKDLSHTSEVTATIFLKERSAYC